MLLAEIDATGWGIIIAAFFMGVGTLATGIGTIIISLYKMHIDSKREDAKVARDAEVAVEVAKVAKDVKKERKVLNKMATTGTKTLQHVNAVLLAHKKEIAEDRRLIANASPSDAVLEARAVAAEKDYTEYKAQQDKMDRQAETAGEEEVCEEEEEGEEEAGEQKSVAVITAEQLAGIKTTGKDTNKRVQEIEKRVSEGDKP